jgi:hypothetical protein
MKKAQLIDVPSHHRMHYAATPSVLGVEITYNFSAHH